ncbi:MAG: hypothetical protein ABH860_05395 [bacterium]
MMNITPGKAVLKLAIMAIMTAGLSFYLSTAGMSVPTKETTVTGTVPLGSARKDVLKAMGKPNSPLVMDFSYKKKNCEILVVFNDTTDMVRSVIVIGNDPKYSVRGIKGGSSKDEVRKIFGNPEKVVNYKGSGTECWFYPSKNVNFALNGGKVSSFSVCDEGNK